MRQTFCTSSIIKRLQGKLNIPSVYYGDIGDLIACVKMVGNVKGKLHISQQKPHNDDTERGDHTRLHLLTEAVVNAPRLTYVSYVLKAGERLSVIIPGTIFVYRCNIATGEQGVHYRPALLNGRHIVDVVRAVHGVTDVSEAELERARREATQNAHYVGADFPTVLILKGVWRTSWRGATLIARE